MDEKLLQRLEVALVEGGIKMLVNEMKEGGLSQVEIYDIFSQFRDFLSQAGRERDEDIVLDIMDYICGFCSPGSAYFSHSLTNEEIEEYQKNKRKK